MVFGVTLDESPAGDARLARHIGNAILRTDSRGQRLTNDARNSPRKIDLAIAAVMAFDGASATPQTYNILESIY